MSPTIFLTGASGYIGGTVLSLITQKHPEWTVSALVRDDTTAAALKKHFPSVKYVVGDLDSHDVIKDASASADVVLSKFTRLSNVDSTLMLSSDMASADDIPAVQSILEGLSQRPAHANRYLIHTSGTGMLADFSTGEGNLAPRVWSDIKDVKEITTLDHTHFHRDVDEAVIDGGIAKNVKTAILSPPTIYGVGLGPLKKRSIQVPALISGILSRGKGFTVGKGENMWDAVHVSDVASAYIFLAEEALEGEKGKAAWGKEGYYFVKDDEFVSRRIPSTSSAC